MKLRKYIETIRDKKAAVIGIGVSNTPLIKYLAENGIGVTARDKASREVLGGIADELEALGVELVLGDSYLDDLTEDIIFRTPGLRPDVPEIAAAVENGSELTSEMELFFKVCPCRIIGVTGSDGKTTTTTVISELLKAEGYTVHIGGNIGRPLLCEADSMSESDFAVLELSSFQLMTMKSSPDIAVITNLAPNHLDVHRDMREYTEAKMNIFKYQTKDSLLVLNADNDITASFAPMAKDSVSLFSRKTSVQNGAYCKDGRIYTVRDGKVEEIMDASDILIPGDHNIENYLAAFSAVRDLVSGETMKKVAMTFSGVEHRIELVRELHGVKYYNDSIASSPSRTTAGLRSFKQKVILIAGGKDKGVPFDTLGGEIIDHVKILVVTGFTMQKIKDAVVNNPRYSGSPRIIEREDFKEAVEAAHDLAESGDIVILSPACTSFDRFKNFMERGEYFKEIVKGLK